MSFARKYALMGFFCGSGDEKALQIVNEINGEQIEGGLTNKLEHTKTQADKIKEFTTTFLPTDTTNVTTLEDCCDYLTDHVYKQEWIRAAELGLSFKYWAENGYASKDVENAITLNTRGIEYTVVDRVQPLSYGACGLFIFPEFTVSRYPNILNDTARFQTYGQIRTRTTISSSHPDTLLDGTVYDFSRLHADWGGMEVAVGIYPITSTTDVPVFVALPNRADITIGNVRSTLINGHSSYMNPGTESAILGYGFSIGEYLDGMGPDTVGISLIGRGEKLVTVMPGYYGKDLYLAKIEMSAETMVNIFNNLATITAGYTINVGSDNLAKLTDEQIAIATEKGWVIT